MSDADERAERVRHHRWLCERAGKLLGLPGDHQRSVIQGSLDFAFEAMINGMIETGKLPNEMAAFIKLSELQMASAPQRPPPHIEIVFSDESATPATASFTPPADGRSEKGDKAQ